MVGQNTITAICTLTPKTARMLQTKVPEKALRKTTLAQVAVASTS